MSDEAARPNHTQHDRLTHSFVVQLLENAAAAVDFESFIAQSLPDLQTTLESSNVLLVQNHAGRWEPIWPADANDMPPTDQLSDAADRETTVVDESWIVTPLAVAGHANLLLAFRAIKAHDAVATHFETTAAALSHALSIVANRQTTQDRVNFLESLSTITHVAKSKLDLADILRRYATIAGENCQAASAFVYLWERREQKLVGFAAEHLPIEDLSQPDHLGTVGHTVQTAHLQQINAAETIDPSDQALDEQLDQTTRNLLCVPITSAEDELLGALEVRNKRDGDFLRRDQRRLRQLAEHLAHLLADRRQVSHFLRQRSATTGHSAQSIALVGDSEPIQKLRQTVRRLARTELAVLLLGENGTGKEVVSRLIHSQSARRAGPFIAVNCAAMSETLLESELFGHEAGAFTDAKESRAGKFELATGGTLFLDEIGDLSRGGQAKLLRVLEEQIIVRVGGSALIHTDARVIAATNQDLAQMVRDERFREDLFFRLTVVTLHLPPLRDRRADIMPLAEHFLTDFAQRAGRTVPQLDSRAGRRLEQHTWPGNVRELRNVMERLVFLTDTQTIDEPELLLVLEPSSGGSSQLPLDSPLPEATRQFQIDYINQHIAAARGNMTEAARQLGLHRSNLYRKMRQLEMMPDDESAESS